MYQLNFLKFGNWAVFVLQGEKDIWQQCLASKIKRLEITENFNNTDSEDSIKYFDELKEFYSKLTALRKFF